MKKNNLFLAWLLAAVIAMLEFSSRSNEPAPEKPVREGMVDVVMTTSLPDDLQTYASNSAKSALENLENQGLFLRYIMEVYTESGELLKRKMQYKSLSSEALYRDAEFSARLFAAKYTFVFYNLDFYFDVYDKDGDEISKNVHVNVPNVPLRENYLTTIKGDLLANTHNITIEILDEFEGTEYIVTTDTTI
ncbi:MAG: hypothetical protein J6C91_02360 [Muribaculaceae bacterium]|nr:hypothetical protein [Muribaculaceae bacterium]